VALEGFEAADSEEFTNKIPEIPESPGHVSANHQMCPIHSDFKHFAAPNAKHFRHWRKVSSIM
jgi:hypothetical protein